MLKLIKDQRGLAGVAEVGLIGLLLVVIVFAGTRVYNATHSADQANQEAIKVSETSPDFSEADTLEEEKKEVEQEPKEEEKEEPKTVTVSEDKPKPEETDKKEEDKPQWIDLNFLGVSEAGETYTFSAGLGGSRSGWCKVKFYKGEQYVHQEGNAFTNKSNCSVSVPKSEFDVNGSWEGYVKFYSNDGKVYGATETVELNVTHNGGEED